MGHKSSLRDVEDALEKNNIGKDATERKALAQKLFALAGPLLVHDQ